MPSIRSGKVLVTGANGYVALWVIKSLLEQGFAVKGTVRSAKKGVHMLGVFKKYVDEGKLEVVVVEDITKESAFDEAVQGVDAIMHTASPFIVATKVDDVVPPAVEGTLSILKSAAKYNSSIKRVIVTSSIASVMDLHPTMRTYTEEDWNTHSTQEIEEKGDATDPTHIYLGSKALAEKAAWEWYESAKEKVGWDLVAILPGFVFGPLLQEIDSPSQLNYSMGLFFQGAMSGTSSEVTQEKALTLIGGWVDVRDVADAHVAALTVEAAKNQRFITSNWSCCVQDISNAAHKINPNIPNRFPYLQIPLPAKNFDSGKSKAVLGIKYKSLEETTKDSLADFKKRGWIQ